MSEILSQNEIDALLSALTTGELNVDEIKKSDKDKKIRLYDFKNPNKFSKDQLRTLDMLHENFSRLLQTYLSAHLRSLVSIELLSVDQMSYHEFINSIPNPSIIALTKMSPLKGSMIFELDPNIAFTIIDRLLGGPGTFNMKVRGLTDIEEIVIKKVINRIYELLTEAWKNIIELKPSLERIETNSQFAQLVAPNETVALLTFSTKIGTTEGMINICLPHIVIEPVVPKLSAKFWFQSPDKGDMLLNRKELEKRMENAPLTISAELGYTNLSIKEFLELQIGDIIRLETFKDSPIKVYIDEKLKFEAKPGVVKRNKAVQIISTIMEGGAN